MSTPLIVNNTYLGSSLPIVTLPIGAAHVPDQIYRNTDNTMFIPTLIIATNVDAVAAERLILVDADITDGGSEITYQSDVYDLFDVVMESANTVILDKDQIPKSLQFRYGVGGYVSANTIDVTVYIEGYEVPTTSTE